ncbi:DNA alkylation repair protein [Anaeroarcus burkinensis]|uniref:DNA alkylation repair protein n=1 Tax=Anaeroarcus burkinensis TaxID=82376 RepID=UPI0003FD0381|nr:DNA alkylation repair protein [Anaeroarcus burkinensis]
MNHSIREMLAEMAEPKYQQFAASLLPNVDNLLGIRLPLLRKLAQKMAKEDWRRYLKSEDVCYFEETMLQGMILGYAKADIEELLSYVVDFVPRIDNWSICDSFCNGLKFTQNHKERVWDFLQQYLVSEQEYEIRFGVVMLLSFYIEEEYIDSLLLRLHALRHEGYYAKMAVAWALSLCYVKFPELTLASLQSSPLDTFTYNKALQKITESYRVDSASKIKIRSMRRK